MDIFAKFSSNFNNSVKSRSKSFQVVKSKATYDLLALLFKEGYILYFYIFGDKYVVYLNHSSINFLLKTFSKPSTKINYKFNELQSSSASGFNYVVKTSLGVFFSDTARVNKFSGRPIYKLKFFALWHIVITFLNPILLIF